MASKQGTTTVSQLFHIFNLIYFLWGEMWGEVFEWKKIYKLPLAAFCSGNGGGGGVFEWKKTFFLQLFCS